MSAVDSLSKALATRPRPLALFETSLLSIITMSAVLGNLLVCCAVYRNHRLRSIPNIFIVALAISDILMSSLPMPLSVEILVRGQFIYSQAVCYFQGFCVFTFGMISLKTMVIIALNRYFKICRSAQRTKLFKFRTAICLIAVNWGTALFASIPPLFLRKAHYTFQPGKAMCLIPFQANIAYTAFVEVVYVATPLILVVICCVLVFRSVQKTNMIFSTRQQDDTRLRANVEEAKVTKTLVVVFVGFAACWMPISVIDYTNAAYGQPELSRSVYLMYGFLVYISSTINPFIYGVMNRSFRSEYCRIIFGLARCRIHRSTESTEGENANTGGSQMAA